MLIMPILNMINMTMSMRIAHRRHRPYLPKMPSTKKDKRVIFLTTEEELTAIDEWRRRQPDLPSRGEALRRMAARVIAQDSAAAD